MPRINPIWCLPALILFAASVAAQELQPPPPLPPAPLPDQVLAPQPIAETWEDATLPALGIYTIPEPGIAPAEFRVPRLAPHAPATAETLFESPPLDAPGIAMAASDSNPTGPVGRQDHYGCKGCGGAPCETCSNSGAEPCRDCPGCTCGSGRIAQWWQTRMKPSLQESHWGYAEQFEEKPFGASLRAHLNTQVCNGTKDRMVLYRYDFHEGILGPSSELNPHGRRRLTELARMLRCNIYPLVIEPTPNDPRLDAARREHVLQLLKDPTFEVPKDWVVVRRPNARPLDGEDAMNVYKSLTTGTQPAASTGGPSIGITMAPAQGENTQ